MTENNGKLWNEVIKNQIDRMSELDVTSDEYGDIVDNLVKMQKIETEDMKTQMDSDEKYAQRQLNEAQSTADRDLKWAELDFKKDQLKEETNLKNKEIELKSQELNFKREQLHAEQNRLVVETNMKHEESECAKIMGYVKIGAELLSVAIPAALYWKVFKTDLKVEEVWTPTNTIVKGMLSKIKPGKR